MYNGKKATDKNSYSRAVKASQEDQDKTIKNGKNLWKGIGTLKKYLKKT